MGTGTGMTGPVFSRGLVAAVALLAACESPPPTLPVVPPASVAVAAPTSSDPPPVRNVVVVRIVQEGPIGNGLCEEQCSYHVEIVDVLSGSLKSGEASWIYYEHCAGSPRPPRSSGSLEPCSLKYGAEYQVELLLGRSKSSSHAPVIVDARLP